MKFPHSILLEQEDKGGGGGGGDQKKTFSEEELKDRLEKARSEEKAKLYEELNNVRAANQEAAKRAEEAAKKAEELAKAAQEAQENLKKLTEEREALIKATKQDGKIDIEQLIKEASERTAKALTEATSAKMKEVENEVSRLRAENQALGLERYRTEKIAAAGGKLVVSLVGGSTDKEIDLSVERAKKAYQEIEDNVKKELGQTSSNNNNNNVPPGIPANRNTSGGNRTPVDLSDIQVERNNPKNWGSEREKVLARVRQRVG